MHTVWSMGHKRTVSNTESAGPLKSKKAKAAQCSDDDKMQVDAVPTRKPPAKRAPKADPKPDTVKSKSRRYLSRVAVNSDDEEEDAACSNQNSARRELFMHTQLSS
ncbi:hypothetical protein B0H13DRAFT_1907366 [Mycena leptocephala]|nr:hypothetical protein B0H13DRAFT_1907366 [Mycena leptocephala]